MAEMSRIRVLIVDDHAVVRNGLTTVLRIYDDLELVGEASNGKEAVDLCQQVRPDVVLMDLMMPIMDGAEATKAIRQRCPQIQVIALTSFKEKDLVQGALEAGAIGYLLKNVSTEELADAIRAAHTGKPTMAPAVIEALTQAQRMEQLARAILDTSPEPADLAALLKEHAPEMFPDSAIEIRIYPDQTLMHDPSGHPPIPESAWQWLHTSSRASCFSPGAELPWGGVQTDDGALLLVPITGFESRVPMGGIAIRRQRDPHAATELIPVIKSLAAQISSAIHSAHVRAQALEHQKVAQELALAGQIQVSFLPESLPDLDGWQFAATMEPARETSGDFYDFIPLPNGHWGIVIADVADKGLGAALYMSLGRSLIRTYATEYPARPDRVLLATNRRLLSDTSAGLFITTFYGVLDPTSGTLTYCNAGHNPPYLIRAQDDKRVQLLFKTGMVLGVTEEGSWEQSETQLVQGDTLLLYTDGLIDAQDSSETPFGERRLKETIVAHTGHSAQDIQTGLLRELHFFMGDAPQADDITLVVIIRES
ncbi:MAG TPA: SpoIIE family protein phosphatase [Anaerolineae bacterium]|nr:SpoIIE family protein phosphatase [Anaerolineae bacterium]